MRWLATLCFFAGIPFAVSAATERLEQGEVLSKEGKVDWTEAGTNWRGGKVGQRLGVGDRLRTMELSRAMVQLVELGRVRVDELTTLEILPPREAASKGTVDLKAGAMYFFTRERPREFLIQTPHALAASRGTEFVVTVSPGGATLFTVFDGEVEVTNTLGGVVVRRGEQGLARAGQAPVKTAMIGATNVVQWWLYYPAILDTHELGLSGNDSLSAYEQGDLLGALASYPAGRTPQSEAERVYYAGVLLAVGRVERAEQELEGVDARNSQAKALREMIASVTLRGTGSGSTPGSASEWLARSYSEQARFNLKGALTAATMSTRLDPEFGFAWERIAELEFGNGHIQLAEKALAKSLRLSPRNAECWALKGFLAAAGRRWEYATNSFNKAISLDGALGQAWLG